MRRAVLIAALFASTTLPASAQRSQVMDLSIMEALVAVGHADMAGIFSFISEKDSAPAFADFLLRNEKSRKKYIAKVDKDVKKAGGLTAWDHAVLQDVVSVYGSPMGKTLPNKASAKEILHMVNLAGTPTLSLDQISAKRRS